jgi:protein-disulfide isomerase
MHDLLYENQQALGESLLLELSDTVDLSSSQLLTAVAEHTYQDRINKDFRGGVRSGVNGTPTFFINGVRHDASYDFATLTAAIESVLP